MSPLKGLRKALLILIFSSLAWAGEPLRRQFELELEEVPGAEKYEVQLIRHLPDGKDRPNQPNIIQTNVWRANLAPGKYTLRVRSIDSRGVRGEWGPPQDLEVPLPAPETVSPRQGAQLQSQEPETDKVKYEWKSIAGAAKYKLQVQNQKGETVYESTEANTSAEAKVPVASNYTWRVAALLPEKIEGDWSASSPFTLIGGELKPPEIKPIQERSPKAVEWTKVPDADLYEYTLEKKDKKGKWQISDKAVRKELKRVIYPPLPAGAYRVSVRAVGDKRKPSPPAQMEFSTGRYWRSPASIEQEKEEVSYEPPTKVFAFASYIASQVQYNGPVHTQLAQGNISGNIGGSGKIGIGTWLNEGRSWGILGTGELSGLLLSNNSVQDTSKTIVNYYSASLLSLYQYRLGAVGKIRGYEGLEIRQLPVPIITDVSITNDVTYNKDSITTLNPVIGFDWFYAFSTRVGIQVDGRLSYSAMSLATPNGGGNIPLMSYQYGLLGSLRITDHLIGFAGYTYRYETGGYKSVADGQNTHQDISGGDNLVKIYGNYLHLLLEYGF